MPPAALRPPVRERAANSGEPLCAKQKAWRTCPAARAQGGPGALAGPVHAVPHAGGAVPAAAPGRPARARGGHRRRRRARARHLRVRPHRPRLQALQGRASRARPAEALADPLGSILRPRHSAAELALAGPRSCSARASCGTPCGTPDACCDTQSGTAVSSPVPAGERTSKLCHCGFQPAPGSFTGAPRLSAHAHSGLRRSSRPRPPAQRAARRRRRPQLPQLRARLRAWPRARLPAQTPTPRMLQALARSAARLRLAQPRRARRGCCCWCR